MLALNRDGHPRARARRNVPLTDEQRDLVAAHARLAWTITWPFARQWPRHADAIRSAANLALVISARQWRPGGGLAFATYAAWRIRAEAGLAIRVEYDQPTTVGVMEGRRRPGRAFDRVDPFDAVALADAEDAAGAVLRRLPRRAGEALRLVAVEGFTQAEAGAAMGLTQHRVSQLIAESRQILGGSHACSS